MFSDLLVKPQLWAIPEHLSQGGVVLPSCRLVLGYSSCLSLRDRKCFPFLHAQLQRIASSFLRLQFFIVLPSEDQRFYLKGAMGLHEVSAGAKAKVSQTPEGNHTCKSLQTCFCGSQEIHTLMAHIQPLGIP